MPAVLNWDAVALESHHRASLKTETETVTRALAIVTNFARNQEIVVVTTRNTAWPEVSNIFKWQP